jgi:predicted nucleic acid-binding protein
VTQPSQIVLDTTVIIDALRNRNQRRAFLSGLVASGLELVSSTVTMAEVYGGLRNGEEQATQAFLSALDWIPVSPAIAERAGNMKAALRRQGHTRSITDMIIAATALESDVPIATDNRKDFQLPGLTLLPLP